MRHSSEEQLYRSLINGHRREVTRLEEGLRRARDLPPTIKLIEAQEALEHLAWGTKQDIEYVERRLSDPQQTAYVIGEAHSSIKAVEFARENLVSKMNENAKSWLFLIEGADKPNPGGFLMAGRFYFPELAKLLRIPCISALADPLSPHVVQYIREAGFTEDDLNKIRVYKTTDQLTAPAYLVDGATIARNRYSKERFHRIRQGYSNRTNILVVVGKRHVQVFQ